MSDTRPFPLRHMASVPARSYAMLDQCAAQTAANGLHDPLIYLSPADIRTAFATSPDIRRHYMPEATDAETARNVANLLSVCAIWRRTQGIYLFDRDIIESLRATDLSVTLPSDVFRRMPAQAVWVGLDGEPCGDGFFAALDDTADGFELLLQPFVGDSPLGTAFIKLDRPLGENGNSNGLVWGSLAFLVMYLCSEEPDIAARPSRLNVARVRSGKLPLHPTEHRVGFRIGAEFRKARDEAARGSGSGADGRPLIPHVRRAHWHSFWVGAHDSPQRRKVVKWLPPIPVNVRDADDLIPVVRNVHRQHEALS